MTIRNLISIGALCLLVWACSDSAEVTEPAVEPVVPDAPITYEFTAEQSRAAEASAPFMDKFWLAAEASMGESNYVVSPLSADILLSMVANTSTGNLGEEILQTLGCIDKTVLNELASKYNVALPALDPSVTLGIYNTSWYKNRYIINPGFVDLMDYYYDAEVVGHPFDNSLVGEVNAWCDRKTNGLIPEIIYNVPDDAVMLIADALYLKGAWANPFDAENTSEKVFRGSRGDSKVMMMNAVGMQHYAENANFQAVRMELGSGAIEAVFVLPREGADMDSFLSENIEAINNANFMDMDIDFSIPRFKFVSGIMRLNEMLGTTGIKSLGVADPTDVLEGLAMIRHHIFQRTSLEFNEQGAEGAAVTWDIAQIEDIGSEYHKPVMNVNRPFYVIVRVAATGAPLFAGRINNL